MTNAEIVEAEMKRLKSNMTRHEWFSLAAELRATLLRVAERCRPATSEDDADAEERLTHRAIREGVFDGRDENGD